jgi:hypothetical protein
MQYAKPDLAEETVENFVENRKLDRDKGLR